MKKTNESLPVRVKSKNSNKKDRRLSPIRRKAIDGIGAGDRFTVTRTFHETEVDTFARISGDYNPVHFDERFARAKGFGGRICHGLLVGSLLTDIGGQIGWLATGMDFRFKKPVFFGDTVRCELVITRVGENGFAEADAVFTGRDGQVVIEARLAGYLPDAGQREIMANGGE